MAEQQVNKDLALEMTMQEVLGNIEELAFDFGYSDGEVCFEILATETPTGPTIGEYFPPRYIRIRSPLAPPPPIPLQQKQRNVA